MNRTTIVFAGPSLPPHFVVGPHLEVRSPARRGDLLTAASEADAIALIDGVMLDDYPPSPTEVLNVLRTGVSVWGASSLGALRAVELATFGMRGHGRVFEAYAAEDAWCDDWLVVPMCQETGAALGLSLFSLRFALARPCFAQVGTTGCRNQLVEAWSRVHCSERTFPMLDRLLDGFGLAEMRETLAHPANDIKVQDCESLLQKLTGGHDLPA